VKTNILFVTLACGHRLKSSTNSTHEWPTTDPVRNSDPHWQSCSQSWSCCLAEPSFTPLRGSSEYDTVRNKLYDKSQINQLKKKGNDIHPQLLLQTLCKL